MAKVDATGQVLLEGGDIATIALMAAFMQSPAVSYGEVAEKAVQQYEAVIREVHDHNNSVKGK